MRDCLTVSADNAPLIPTKRVNYTFGMVLGVDDFRQEQAHFEWKHQLSNRLLHGYGTVCGLQVSARAVVNPSDVEIRIAAGYGLSPQGKWMWVEHDQCARLGAWLERQDAAISPPLAPGRHTIYVNLCYVECATDLVPIAGQACASEEDTRAPSRIQEAFRAELALTPPPQPAEDRMRQFGDLLAQIEIVSETASPVMPDDSDYFLELVRNLAVEASPPLASPPETGPIRLNALTACETLRRALTIWTTEVCPHLQPPQAPEAEDCILLSCVDFDVDASGRLSFVLDPQGNLAPGSVEVDDCVRPVLVPDRLKQELFCLLGREASIGILDHGSLTGLEDDDHPQYHTDARGDARYAPIDHTHALDDLADVNAPEPIAGQVLTWDQTAAQWQPLTVTATGTAGGDLSGTYPNPTVARIQTRAIATTPPANGQVLTWNQTAAQWQPQAVTATGTAGGDLSGTYPNPTVARIQTRAIATTPPANGQVLTWNQTAAQWQPQAVTATGTAGGDLSGTYPNPTVARIQTRAIATTPPANGQVLTWNQTAAQWQPQAVTATGDFVLAPFGRYAIVAAGWFDRNGSPQGQVYNALTATPPTPTGDCLLNFPGYAPPGPNEKFMYIVKGTVQMKGRSEGGFYFVDFLSKDQGISVRVPSQSTDGFIGFMVEISAFGEFPLP